MYEEFQNYRNYDNYNYYNCYGINAINVISIIMIVILVIIDIISDVDLYARIHFCINMHTNIVAIIIIINGKGCEILPQIFALFICVSFCACAVCL